MTIEDFIQSCKDEWETNKKVKDSQLKDCLNGDPFNLFYNEYTMEWTPIEMWAFKGYLMTKLTPYFEKKVK